MAKGNSTFDVVVVGGGVVGCAAADALSRRGMRVALIERGKIGQGTSGNSFAWINGTSKASDEAYHRLNAGGASRYRELAAELGERRMGLHPTGMLEWASPTDPVRLELLRRRVEQLQAWDYPVVTVNRDELAAMEPEVAFEDGAEGLFAAADPWLDVPRFLQCLVGRLRENGCAVLEQSAATELIASDEGKVSALETTSGRITCGRIVVAVGPDTPGVLSTLTGYDGFAARFPMRRSPGLLVSTPGDGPRRLARHILYSSDAEGLHLRESPDGGLLLGADDTDGVVAQDVSPARIRNAAVALLDRARRFIPRFEGAAIVDRCTMRVGVRAVPADGKSIVGPMPGARGLHIVVTHSGITLAPVLGELVAESIDTGTVPLPLAPFALERFQSFA